MARNRVFAVCLVGAAAAVPLSARADLIGLHAEVQGGGAGGLGLGGELRDDAFHAGTTGLAYGALVGVEVLFVDGWVEHAQYQNETGLAGTWTQFMVGVDLKLDLGVRPSVVGSTPKGRSATFAEFGLATGLGVGTGQQVMRPLDNSQVTDKGFVFQASAALSRRLGEVFSIGIRAPVQVGYLFKNDVVNRLSNHYQSMQAAVYLNLRADIALP